jgi:hypothetical protein
MSQFPCLIRTSTAGGEARFALGERPFDSFAAGLAGRGDCRVVDARFPDDPSGQLLEHGSLYWRATPATGESRTN